MNLLVTYVLSSRPYFDLLASPLLILSFPFLKDLTIDLKASKEFLKETSRFWPLNTTFSTFQVASNLLYKIYSLASIQKEGKFMKEPSLK
jgi:hypothetical protein